MDVKLDVNQLDKDIENRIKQAVKEAETRAQYKHYAFIKKALPKLRLIPHSDYLIPITLNGYTSFL